MPHAQFCIQYVHMACCRGPAQSCDFFGCRPCCRGVSHEHVPARAPGRPQPGAMEHGKCTVQLALAASRARPPSLIGFSRLRDPYRELSRIVSGCAPLFRPRGVAVDACATRKAYDAPARRGTPTSHVASTVPETLLRSPPGVLTPVQHRPREFPGQQMIRQCRDGVVMARAARPVHLLHK